MFVRHFEDDFPSNNETIFFKYFFNNSSNIFLLNLHLMFITALTLISAGKFVYSRLR